MTVWKTVVMMTAIAVLGSAATAQETPKSDVKPPKEWKTCRSMMATGTIMATRVCNTAAAWKAFDAYTADGADQFRATYRMTSTGKTPS